MPIPPGRHTDWHFKPDWPVIGPILGVITYPFGLIPRRWTAFESNTPPVKIWGTERVEDNLDIPERGRWVIAGVGNIKLPVYFAFTTTGGRNFRIGLFRYTYPDVNGGGGYYQVGSFKIGKYKNASP